MDFMISRKLNNDDKQTFSSVMLSNILDKPIWCDSRIKYFHNAQMCNKDKPTVIVAYKKSACITKNA